MEEYKVGDEVIVANKRCIVTKYIENSIIYVLSSSGVTLSFGYPVLYSKDNIIKTGKHYPQVDEILKELEEPIE